MAAITTYKKRDGKEYFKVKLYIGDGKYVSRSGFESKKDAKDAQKKLQLAIDQKEYQKTSTKTYQDMYDLWMTEYETDVERSTLGKTKGLFKNHILPALGRERIDKLDYVKCQKAVIKWSDDLKRPDSLKSYASSVLDFAIRHEHLQKNPFELVKMPKKKVEIDLDEDEKVENFYTREQLLTFLNHMKHETNVKAYVFYRLLSFSGIRRGEALALTWRDINFKSNEIRITRALSLDDDNKVYLKTTKTRESRTIKMDSETMAILKKWKNQQREEYFALGFNTSKPGQLVFSNQNNELMQVTKPRKWLVHVLEKYDLPWITTHGFRHTHCSLLFESGASIKEVQDRLGHKDVQTTLNIYAHLSKDAKDGVVDKFTNYLSMQQKTGTDLGTE